MALKEDKKIKLLIDELNKIRDKFIGTTTSDPLNNQRLSSNSGPNPRIRVIHEVMGVLIYKFLTNKKLDLSPIDKGYDHGKEIEKKRKSAEFKSSKIELLEKDELLIKELEDIEEMEPGDDKEIAFFDFDQKVQKILFKKLYNLDLTERKVSPIEIAKARNIDTSYEILIDPQKIKNDSSYLDNTIETLLFEDQLARRLNDFKKKYDSSLNETGSSCVYLTCGNISYKESEASNKIYNSPLLLLRLKIEKNNDISNECKKYKFSDDNANLIFNRSLSKTLEKKFGITLNEFNYEEFSDYLETAESTSKYIESYFKKIKNKIKGKTEIKFSSFCTFDTFNTLKLIQWNDCNWEKWEGDPSSLDSLNSIIFGQENKSISDPLSYDEISLDLDETYRKDVPVTILKSDVSQHAAIVAALNGESIVLQGPPGTGKSQTIANLIMHLCLSGKKVLFMAAKKPALDVVHKKLKESHHHNLCTIFDNYKMKKETFYENIKNIIEIKTHNLKNKAVTDELESNKKAFLNKVDFSSDYYKKTVEDKIINIQFLEEEETSLNLVDSISLLNILKTKSQITDYISNITKLGPISNNILDNPSNNFLLIKKLIQYTKDNNIDKSSNLINNELYAINEGVNIDDLKSKIKNIQNLFLESRDQLTKILEFGIKETVRYPDLHNLSVLLDAYQNVDNRDLNKDLLDIILRSVKENQDLNTTCSTFSTIVSKFSEESIFNRTKTYRLKKLTSFYINTLPAIDPSIVNLTSEERQMYDIEIGHLDKEIKDINGYISVLREFDSLCEIYDKFFKKYTLEISTNMIERKLFYQKLIKVLTNFTENQRYFRYLNSGINYKIFNDFFDQENIYQEEQSNDSKSSLESFYSDLKSLPLTQYLNEIVNINGFNLESRSFSTEIKRKIAEIDDNIKENTSILCKIKSFIFLKNFKEIRTTVPIKNIKDHEIVQTLNLAKEALSFIEKFYKILMSNRKSLEIFLRFADLSDTDKKDEPTLLIDWICSDPKHIFEKMIDFAQILNINKKFEDSISKDFTANEQGLIYNILNDDELIDNIYESQDVLLVKPREVFQKVSEMIFAFDTNKNRFLIDRKSKYLISEFDKILDTFSKINDNSEIFNSKTKLINIFNNSKEISTFINDNLKLINNLEDFIFSELTSEESKKIIGLSKHLSLVESTEKNAVNLFNDSGNSFDSLRSFIETINTLEKDFAFLHSSYGLKISHKNLDYLIEGKNDISCDYITDQLNVLKEIGEGVNSPDFLHILNIKNLFGKDGLIVKDYLTKFNTIKEIIEYAEDILTCIYLEYKIKNHISSNSKLYDNENYIKNINDFIIHENELVTSFKKKVHLMQKLNKLRMPAGNTGRIKDLTEMQLVSHVTAKPKARVSIHSFMKRAFESMSLLTPCFIADPSAVSNFFKQEYGLFDVVIMDEASQIKLEDSIPTLARGKQFIIAGDSQQLPPTSFFTAKEKEEKEEQIGDVASLLEIANSRLGLGKSSKQLLVHYRSKYSELIKFSNEKFYNDRLVIPPSTETIEKSKCIEYFYLDKDKTDYKQGGTNIAEISEITKYLEDFTSKEENLTYSILIGTSNKEQKELIEDAIDILEADSPSFRRYRNYWDKAKEGTERLIVQNLESIQGDERDVVIISTVYGPERGATAMRQSFGPINREGGYKRLNVIITRQRLKLVVFTSMLSSHLTESEHISKGKAALKDWLKYLETGLIAIRPEEVNHETDSYFEESVKIALESNPAFNRYEKHTQVKQSGFRIDMALYDREKGEYVLGIECDGAAYHSSKTAKDRDRNRQEILEFKGWKIHRIWSTDWFKNPKSEIEKLQKKLIIL